jgi:DNA processing protein
LHPVFNYGGIEEPNVFHNLTVPIMTEKEAFIALNLIPGLGPVRTRALIAAMGSPQRVLRACAPELQAVEGVGTTLADTIAEWESHVDLSVEMRMIEDFGATVIHWNDPAYPELLREIHSPPIVLYVWGRLDSRDRHAVGVVGSRRSTHYGEECAKKLSYQLAYTGITVVSGLARGIDTAAHQGALAAKGRTIACLGSGLLELYPTENRALAERIASSGAVVSEFPMATKPDRQTFPMRNRIISGWSFGTLLVEAPLRSGALITVNQAMEQGRAVYAVPGPIDRPTSQGCNRLIQQGAKLVVDAADILDDFGMLFPPRSQPTLSDPVERHAPELNAQERAVYNALGDSEKHINTLIDDCGLPSAAVLSALVSLELKHLAKQLPGKFFVRLG